MLAYLFVSCAYGSAACGGCAYGFEEAGAGDDFFEDREKRAERAESSSPSSPFLPKPNFFIVIEIDIGLRRIRAFQWEKLYLNELL